MKYLALLVVFLHISGSVARKTFEEQCEEAKKAAGATCTITEWVCKPDGYESRKLEIKRGNIVSGVTEARMPCQTSTPGNGGNNAGSGEDKEGSGEDKEGDGEDKAECSSGAETENGKCCVFPFMYGGKKYENCTNAGHNRQWCATTNDYPKDKEWSNCIKETGTSGNNGNTGTYNCEDDEQGKYYSAAPEVCLISANAYRERHVDTNNLQWDATIAEEAKCYAVVLAKRAYDIYDQGKEDEEKLLIHDEQRGNNIGENLAFRGQSSAGTDESMCKDADQRWYDEINSYSYTTTESSDGKAVGHFTQMVWRESTKVGYGVATVKLPTGMTLIFVVARYNPQGNINFVGKRIEDYSDNVKPLKEDDCCTLQNKNSLTFKDWLVGHFV